MSNKKDTVKLLEAQNRLLRAENDRLKSVVEIKDRQISCLKEIAISESVIIGEKNARERLSTLTKCCCESEVE